MKSLTVAAILGLVVVALASQPDECVLNSYDRGVGTIPNDCGDKEDQAGLCYTKCKDNYVGDGPVCWEKCPDHFTDEGVTCAKPDAYGRGAGYVSLSECLTNNAFTGCEQYGDLYYPKCRASYHNVGCCVCSPDCPGDMTDAGIDCTKNSYGRGVGTEPHCADLDESDGLCYKQCDEGFVGAEELCWEKDCPAQTKQCGFVCLDAATDCPEAVESLAIEEITLAIATIVSLGDGNLTMAIVDEVAAVLGIEDFIPDHFCGETPPVKLH